MNHPTTTTSPRLSARLAAAGGVTAVLLLTAAPLAQADSYPPQVEPTETTAPPAEPPDQVSPSAATLPQTGSEIGQIAAAGVAVVAGGTALVVLGRRRGLRRH
jgi:LPXTG-motif cell wall-anchored protein